MTRDDRDIESSNPSKSFKVGDFDRLSGFFTPVWESKRRIRSESPIPSSGPASSKSEAGKAPTKPTPPEGIEAAASPEVPRARSAATSPAPAPAVTSKTSDAPASTAAAVPAPAKLDAPKAPAAKAPSLPPAKPSEAAPAAPAPAKASTPSAAGELPSVLTKSLKATIRQGPSVAPSHQPELSAALPAPTVAAAPAASAPAPAAPAATAAASGAARVASDAKLKPAASVENSAAPERSKLSAPRPSVAALAQAGPNLPAEAFLDPKPDFRMPVSKFTPAPQAERIHTTRQRSLRASVAATRVHEQLRARAEADSFDAPELQWGTETDREASTAPVGAAAAGAPSDDPYPLHLLRRLRRTIHLVTPLPESVREMIARYGRN